MLRKLHPGSAHDAIAGHRPVWLALAAAFATLALGAGGPAPARAAGTGGSLSVTEGAAFTQAVASSDCTKVSSATIHWGDGQNSAGTLQTFSTFNSSGTAISGSHTYAEEGDYSGSVDLVEDCGTGSETIDFSAHAADAALSASAHDFSATATVAFSGVGAHFSDANLNAPVGDFSATVSWGDGHSSAGTVSLSQGGGFDVTGGHTYAAKGSFPVTVSITDSGGSTAGAHATATVAPPPPPPPGAPHASFVRSPQPVCTHQLVSFDGSSSTPGSSPIVDYAWDLGDGRGVRHTGTNPTISTVYDYNRSSPYLENFGGWTDWRDPVHPQLVVTDAQGRHSEVTDPNTHTIDFLDFEVNTPLPLRGFPQRTSDIDPRCLKNRVWPDPASVAKKSALLVASGGATVPVHCGPGRVSCLGALSVEAVVRGGRLRVPTLRHPVFRRVAASRHRRAVLLGVAAFRIRPGTTAKVHIRWTGAGRKLLRRYRSGAVLLAISWPTANGHTKTATRKLRIKRKRGHSGG